MKIVISHNAGFFSCCTVRLNGIIDCLNKTHKLPDLVDSAKQFEWYKTENRDITFDYFEYYDKISTNTSTNKISFDEWFQFKDYSLLQFEDIVPLINRYFSPSIEIKLIIAELEFKYNIDYDNTCVLFYRGNDKLRETLLCDYDEYITYANEVLVKNPNTIFFIQSDETEFIEYILRFFPNSFYMKEEIRHMKKCDDTVDHKMKTDIGFYSKNYLAITIIMSKCNYIICGSGNCSLWIIFYRGNNKKVFQNLNGKWIK